jgi:predicted transcriptional regulator
LEKSEHYDDYPRPVSELTQKLLEGLEEEDFFETEKADYNITFRRFADSALRKWIKGEEMEDFTEDEFSQILRFSMVETDLNRMEEKGLLDSIEDENGESMYFLTDKGKIEVEKFVEGKNPSK